MANAQVEPSACCANASSLAAKGSVFLVGKQKLKLGVRQSNIAPVILGIMRELFDTKWTGQLHDRWSAKDHDTLASETDHPLACTVRHCRRIKSDTDDRARRS